MFILGEFLGYDAIVIEDLLTMRVSLLLANFEDVINICCFFFSITGVVVLIIKF